MSYPFEEVNSRLDELTSMGVDWRNARKAGITPRRLRAALLTAVIEIAYRKSSTPPEWFRPFWEELKQLEKEQET